MKYCFGIDVGGTSVKAGLFTVSGEIVDKWDLKTNTQNEGAAIIPDITASIKNKMREHQLNPNQIVGVGMGVPAPVIDGSRVLNTANLGWKYKEVKREMEEILGFPCAVENDANVAALGEFWKGGGRGAKSMIMVTLGTGVGGGIILNGKILSGVHGAAGEIGHVKVNRYEEESCGCGAKGCLEQYCSATGIARLARMKLASSNRPSVLREYKKVSAKSVFDGVKSNDTLSIEIAKEFGELMGLGLSSIAAVIDPDVIVIGGGVSRAGRVVIDYIKEPFLKRAFFANKEIRFELAQLENDAGIVGAAKLILG